MPAPPDLRQPTGSGAARVLVCDDTEQIRVLLRLNLELEGYAVEEVANGREALERLRSDGPPFDVITLDALMPGRDGWTTVADIRSDPLLRNLVVVMVTASTQHTDYERAVRVGVDAFVEKPFEPEQLISVVDRLIRERTAGDLPVPDSDAVARS